MVAPVASASMPLPINPVASSAAGLPETVIKYQHGQFVANTGPNSTPKFVIPSQTARDLAFLVLAEQAQKTGESFRAKKLSGTLPNLDFELNRLLLGLKRIESDFCTYASGGVLNRLASSFEAAIQYCESNTKSYSGNFRYHEESSKELITRDLSDYQKAAQRYFDYCYELKNVIHGVFEDFAENSIQIPRPLRGIVTGYVGKDVEDVFEIAATAKRIFNLLPLKFRDVLNFTEQYIPPNGREELGCRAIKFLQRDCLKALFLGEDSIVSHSVDEDQPDPNQTIVKQDHEVIRYYFEDEDAVGVLHLMRAHQIPHGNEDPVNKGDKISFLVEDDQVSENEDPDLMEEGSKPEDHFYSTMFDLPLEHQE